MCCTLSPFSFIEMCPGWALSIHEMTTFQIWGIFVIFKIIFLPHFLCLLSVKLLLSDVRSPELSSNFLNVFYYFFPTSIFLQYFWEILLFFHAIFIFYWICSVTLKFNFKICELIFPLRFYNDIYSYFLNATIFPYFTKYVNNSLYVKFYSSIISFLQVVFPSLCFELHCLC